MCMFFVSRQATNLSSNGSLTREPRENKVRSMATQLQAKFESTPRYTVRNSQVNKKNPNFKPYTVAVVYLVVLLLC